MIRRRLQHPPINWSSWFSNRANRRIRRLVKIGDEGVWEMKFWKWLRDALCRMGTLVFLVAFIAFLLSMLMTIYIRSMVR